MSLDRFLGKRFHAENYNCVHFMAEVWEHLTGEKIHNLIECTLLPPKDRYLDGDIYSNFIEIEQPESPCIVLMSNLKKFHVGVYFNNNILHLNTNGARVQSLDDLKINFNKFRYFKR